MHAVVLGKRTFYKQDIQLASADIKSILLNHSGKVYFGISNASGTHWLISPEEKTKPEIISSLECLLQSKYTPK